MSRGLKIGLIGAVILVVILVVWILGSSKSIKPGANNKQTVTYSNWDEEYVLSSKEPLGLYHWNALLQLHLDKGKSISTIDYLYSIDTIPRNTNPTFIFVGDYFALYQEELDSILVRVRDGGNLFIAGEKIDGLMLSLFFSRIETGYYYDTTIDVSTKQNTFTFTSKFQGFSIATQWNGYKNSIPNDGLSIDTLSGFGYLTNSFTFSLGKGKIYLNTTPELFTNYQILTQNGFDYSKIWLDKIPKNESIYWLEMARYKVPDPNDFFQEMLDEKQQDDSYLQYIFQDKNRIYAMLLVIGGIILFLIFRAKRMQPLVPFIPKKRNMTMIFADTITSIYFNQRIPFAMVKIQKANFYSIVHKHFHIDLSKQVTDKEIESLAQKTNVKQQVIQTILQRFNDLKEQNTSEYELSELRKLILNFYRQSGIISSRIQDKLDVKMHVVYRNEWISGLFLLSGIGVIVLGLYYLSLAIGIGVLLWPIGAIPIIIGSLRLTKPYISWSNKQMIATPLIGKKKIYNLEDLSSVYQDGRGVQFHFLKAVFELKYWELNRADGKQFKHFVDAHNKLK